MSEVSTLVRTEKLTKNNINVLCETLDLSEFSCDENYLEWLYNNEELRTVFANRGAEISKDKHISSSFGIVCSCENGTMLKFSSLREYNAEVISEFDEYFDLQKKQLEANEQTQKAILDEIFGCEAFVYELLSDSERQSVVAPFIVAIRVDGKIYDYLNCVNMPEYIPVREHMKKFEEAEVLKMSKDILECLKKAHSKGIRHRDIKVDNIMYDPKADKYVLIDWGSSVRYSRRGIGNESSEYPFSYTEYYVDPARVESYINSKSDSDSPNTDLYSLGVVMAFLAHEKGCFYDESISEFHSAVCPDSKIDDCRIIDKEIYKTLKDVSPEFKEIVKKAMNHDGGYEYAADMSNDIKSNSVPTDDEDSGNIVEEKKKKKKEIKFHLLVSDFIIAAFLILYTLILSGSDGFEMTNMGIGIIVCVLCGFPTTLTILYKILFKNENVYYIKISLKAVLGGIALLCALSLATNYFLVDLNENITIDITFIQYIFVVFSIFAVSRIRIKNPLVDRLTENLACGCLYGLCVGLCVSFRIAEGNLSNVLSGGMVKLIALLTLCGLIFGAIIYLWWFKSYISSRDNNK